MLTSTCTFQEEPGTVEGRARWISEHGPRHPVLVAEDPAGTVVGWGSLSPYHPRSAYRHTVENSVYVHADQRRRGIGRALLAELVARARAAEHRLIVAAISADHPASLAQHAALGFDFVGTLRAAGLKFGRWIDVSYMQLSIAP